MSPIWKAGLALAILAADAEPVAQGGSVRGAASVFRSGVDLVTVHVTVTDRSRQYLTGLDERQFRVFENGRLQELRFFQTSGLPLALTFVVDTSSSVHHVLPEFQRAAARFVGELEPQDIASVVAFNDTVRVVQDFTSDRAALVAAISGLSGRGATALYNGLFIALDELRKIRPDPATRVPRRRTLVVLSDGDDTSSMIDFDRVRDLAIRSHTAIYTIRLGRPRTGLRRAGEGEFVLRRLAAETGARAFFPLHGYEVARVLSDIRRELSSQYALAYESPQSGADEEYRSLAVLVARPGAVARTRPGYFAGGERVR